MVICKLTDTPESLRTLIQERVLSSKGRLNRIYIENKVRFFTTYVYTESKYRSFIIYPSSLEFPVSIPCEWQVDTDELTDTGRSYSNKHIVLTNIFSKATWEDYYWLTYSYGGYFYGRLVDLPTLSICRRNKAHYIENSVNLGDTLQGSDTRNTLISPLILGITRIQSETIVEIYAKLFLSEFPSVRPSYYLFDHNKGITDNIEIFLNKEGKNNKNIKAFLNKEISNA